MVSNTAAHPNAWLGCPQYREDSDVAMVHGYNVDIGKLVIFLNYFPNNILIFTWFNGMSADEI